MIVFIGTLIGLGLFIYSLKYMGVVEFEFGERKLKVSLVPEKPSPLKVSPLTTFDIVISSNGLAVKTHLMIATLREENIQFTGWWLDIKGLGKMIFRQYFFENESGARVPLGKIYKLPNKLNQSFVIGLEFGPEGDWEELQLQKRKYNATLSWDSVKGKNNTKFSFRIREQELIAIKNESTLAKKQSQVRIVSLPRIK